MILEASTLHEMQKPVDNRRESLLTLFVVSGINLSHRAVDGDEQVKYNQ